MQHVNVIDSLDKALAELTRNALVNAFANAFATSLALAERIIEHATIDRGIA